jgi:hypothetical protein
MEDFGVGSPGHMLTWIVQLVGDIAHDGKPADKDVLFLQDQERGIGRQLGLPTAHFRMGPHQVVVRFLPTTICGSCAGLAGCPIRGRQGGQSQKLQQGAAEERGCWAAGSHQME